MATNQKQLLPFISDKDLKKHAKRVLEVAESAVESAEEKLYDNAVDPFSALFDALRQGITLSAWLEQEKSRQIQKTMQNAIGEFHEDVLGSMPGWEKLPVGSVIDIRNDEEKIIAEVKNKHNTTKGSDKKTLYDNLKSQLEKSRYRGYTGYYVEIVPKGRRSYDKPFTPSDNVTGTRRPKEEKIRVMDGRTFYAKASGHSDALKTLYEALPTVIGNVLGTKPGKDKLLRELFKKAY